MSEYSTPVIELDRMALDEFATEIRRTLYYYEREYPSLCISDRVILGLDDQGLSTLASELAHRLGSNVDLLKIPTASHDDPEAANALAMPSGIVYGAAFGLAQQGAGLSKVPRMDLYAIERSASETQETKRNFKGSIATSLAAILLGTIGTTLYRNQINQIQGEIKRTDDKAASIRAQIDGKISERHKQAEQYKAISKEGIPVTAILDAIAGSVQPGTGLASVSVSPTKAVTIEGEAVDETSMIRTMKTLEQCPLLDDVKILGFQQLSEDRGVGITFRLGGKTFSSDEIQVHKSGGAN